MQSNQNILQLSHCFINNSFNYLSINNIANFTRSFKQDIEKFNNNLRFKIKTIFTVSEKNHTSDHIFHRMCAVNTIENQPFATRSVLGCRDFGKNKAKKTASENNNNDYDNNNRCDNNRCNNNVFLKTCFCVWRYIYTSIHRGLSPHKKSVSTIPTLVAATVFSFTTACANKHYIYRVEYPDGTVEYHDANTVRSIEQSETPHTVIRIKPEDISKYETE